MLWDRTSNPNSVNSHLHHLDFGKSTEPVPVVCLVAAPCQGLYHLPRVGPRRVSPRPLSRETHSLSKIYRLEKQLFYFLSTLYTLIIIRPKHCAIIHPKSPATTLACNQIPHEDHAIHSIPSFPTHSLNLTHSNWEHHQHTRPRNEPSPTFSPPSALRPQPESVPNIKALTANMIPSARPPRRPADQRAFSPNLGGFARSDGTGPA